MIEIAMLCVTVLASTWMVQRHRTTRNADTAAAMSVRPQLDHVALGDYLADRLAVERARLGEDHPSRP